jgi:long-chain acyl-CoA synthetase
MATIDVISAEQAGTLYGLFTERLQRSPNQTAYRSYNSDTKEWFDTTWAEVATQVARWQAAFNKEQLQPGDRVAINLHNCVEWVIFDQAALGLGLTLVPLYPDDRPNNVAYILRDANVKVLLLQNSKQWQRLKPAITPEHELTRVLIQNKESTPLGGPANYVHDWLSTDNAELQNTPGQPHDLASIIYTSGTTGRPKGVMLSHQNMLSVAYGGLKCIDILPSDIFLSFLPLSHTLERTAGYYLPIMAGATVAYARGIPQLAEDMLQVKPTALIAVPRIFERIYTRVHSQLKEKSPFAQRLFHKAVATGLQRFEYQQKRQSWHPKLLLWPLFNKLVASKIKQRLGGNMRIILSGGAALPQTVAELFIGLDFCLLQGYGLTETSPVISVNTPENNFPSSVGTIIPGVTVKIGDNDELLAKGTGVMLGYWHNDEATSQTIDSEGWLHTGDQARISDTGHVYITGRIKDILVMSNGEKVPPGDIETAILMNPLFEQVLVLGEGQSFIAALIILNADSWPDLAQSLSLAQQDSNSLTDKRLHSYISKQLRQALSTFPAYAKIRQVSVHLTPWTVENDLMTPTMKIKRPKVIVHHQAEIDHIYNKKQKS